MNYTRGREVKEGATGPCIRCGKESPYTVCDDCWKLGPGLPPPRVRYMSKRRYVQSARGVALRRAEREKASDVRTTRAASRTILQTPYGPASAASVLADTSKEGRE